MCTLCMCVCPLVYHILSAKVFILLAKWGHFSGPHNFKGLFEGQYMVEFELGLGCLWLGSGSLGVRLGAV